MSAVPPATGSSQSVTDVLAEVDAECRQRSIPMLGPQKAARLVQLVREQRPQLVVEVGTAIGYSALWLAGTLRELGRGRIVTLESDPDRAAEAARNFERAGVQHLITQLVGDARERIGEVREPIDLLFLDGGFTNYYPCLLRCQPFLRDGALLVADNAGIGAAEMADYLDHVRGRYRSRTEWFETDLAWVPRDAMEISVYRAT
jgi:predicted O-methyltransferase YrrM